MKLTMRNFPEKRKAGLTLVELMVTIMISSIVLSGLVLAYSDALSYWRSAAEKMAMYEEGTEAMTLMGRYIRQAQKVEVEMYNGRPGPRIQIQAPVKRRNYIVVKSAEFYHFGPDKSLRWNSTMGQQSVYNKKLIPIFKQKLDPGEEPYLKVKDVRFSMADETRPNNPSLNGCSMVKIELVLEDSRGDTLYLSDVVARRNKAGN